MATAQSTVIYKDIPEFPGYRAGDDGTIWSCLKRRRLATPDGRLRGSRFDFGSEWRVLKPYTTGHGYQVVGLGRRPRQVHRLVLLAFVGPCPRGMECCHWDGNRANNKLANLRWDTRRANHSDKIRHGTHRRGSSNPSSKLTEDRVRAIRTDYNTGGMTYREVGAKYGVHLSTVALIVNRRIWGHLA